jgi:hypothetical protein
MFLKYKIIHTHDRYDFNIYVAKSTGNKIDIEDAISYLQFVAAEEWGDSQDVDNQSIILGLTSLYGFVPCSESSDAEIIDIFYCWEKHDNPVNYPPSKTVLSDNPLYRPKEDVLAIFYPYIVMGDKYEKHHEWIHEDREWFTPDPWMTEREIKWNEQLKSFNFLAGKSYTVKTVDQEFPLLNERGDDTGKQDILKGIEMSFEVLTEVDKHGFISIKSDDGSTRKYFVLNTVNYELVEETIFKLI